MEQDVIERDAGDSRQINITINVKCVCRKCNEQKEKEVVIKEEEEETTAAVESQPIAESARKKWMRREEKALKDALVKPEELVKHKKSILPRFLQSIKRKSLTLLEDDIKKNEMQTFEAPPPPSLKSAMRSRSPSPARKQVNFDVDTEAVKETIQEMNNNNNSCIRMEYSNNLHVVQEEVRSATSASADPLITVESLIPELLQHPLPSEMLLALRQYIENKYYLKENKRCEEKERETQRPLFRRSKLLPLFKAAATGLKLAMVAGATL